MFIYLLQGKQAELHLSKFGNGTNGKSIKYKGEWMTPEDYELVCKEHLVGGHFINLFPILGLWYEGKKVS